MNMKVDNSFEYHNRNFMARKICKLLTIMVIPKTIKVKNSSYHQFYNLFINLIDGSYLLYILTAIIIFI